MSTYPCVIHTHTRNFYIVPPYKSHTEGPINAQSSKNSVVLVINYRSWILHPIKLVAAIDVLTHTTHTGLCGEKKILATAHKHIHAKDALLALPSEAWCFGFEALLLLPLLLLFLFIFTMDTAKARMLVVCTSFFLSCTSHTLIHSHSGGGVCVCGEDESRVVAATTTSSSCLCPPSTTHSLTHAHINIHAHTQTTER